MQWPLAHTSVAPAVRPVRIVVDRDKVQRLIDEVDHCRDEVTRALIYIESGRTQSAADVLAMLQGRLG